MTRLNSHRAAVCSILLQFFLPPDKLESHMSPDGWQDIPRSFWPPGAEINPITGSIPEKFFPIES